MEPSTRRQPRMNRAILYWRRFETFRRARETFRKKSCIYVLADQAGEVLRIGESDDLWQRYVGGTGWMVDAALHGSGKVIFAAVAPVDLTMRRRIEAALIFRCQPQYCVQHKLAASPVAPEIEHQGDVPPGLR